MIFKKVYNDIKLIKYDVNDLEENKNVEEEIKINDVEDENIEVLSSSAINEVEINKSLNNITLEDEKTIVVAKNYTTTVLLIVLILTCLFFILLKYLEDNFFKKKENKKTKHKSKRKLDFLENF